MAMNTASMSALQDDWPVLSELLDEALALPLPQRDEWLAGLAGVSAEHQEALRALLATQAAIETDDFLADLPPLALTTPRYEGATPGAIVGPYRLISQIGQGGMASVWLAERADGLVKRPVALKLPAVAWGEAFATRLAREREILASLTHEHIARLYDAGVDAQGRPFLAMEVIAGAPIDVFCRERQLPLAERIDLLLQVMAAVAHAHARLVVHRDLKPSNILVSAEAKVSLLDFGIAKLLEGELTEETALTRAAGHALTPDYASPEQIRGEPLGTASDIYSLAVVAYELLAGGRPYRLKRANAAELAQAIAATDVPLASETAGDKALKRQLQGDLDAILNKALKKRPDERYVSMDAFAQDLRRWRDGEPVQARPDGLAYRAVKFAGRYRLQVAAGSIVIVALLAGTSVALWQAREARLQAQRARTEAATAEAVQGFLESVFRANSGDQADPKKASETTARELLDRGAERIDKELAAAPMARLRLLGILGSMYEDMVAEDRQLALQRKRLALAREITGAASDETVLAMAEVAHALTSLEQPDEAAQLLKDATATLDARHDTGSPTRLRVLLMQASLDRRIDPPHGLAASEQALAIARRSPPNADLVLILQLLGDNALEIGEAETARRALVEAVQITEAHPQFGASELALMHQSLGKAQWMLGEFAQADRSYRQSIETAKRSSAAPVEIHYAEVTFANFLCDTGRFADALQAIQPADAWARTEGASGFGMAVPLMPVTHGRALVARGRAAEGLAAIDASLSIAAARGPVPDFFEVRALSHRAGALIDLGRLAEAQAALDRADALIEARPGQAFAAFVGPVRRRWLVASGRAGDALAAFHAMRVARKLPPVPDASAPADALAESAWLELETGNAATARAQATLALHAIATGQLADYQRDPEARATLVLGQALMREQQPAQALPVLERAVELHRAEYDPDHSPAVAEARRALADARRVVSGTSLPLRTP